MGGVSGAIEADETYVGGKAKNRHFSKPAPKKIVMALVEREGTVRSFHIAQATGETLRSVLVSNADRGSFLITDEHPGYIAVGKEFLGHQTVSHGKGEYTRGIFHTNTVEGFFSIFKRGIIGVYHHVSEQHLARYTAEFDLRYNTRDMNDGERANEILKGAIGRRLTYRRTHRLAA